MDFLAQVLARLPPGPVTVRNVWIGPYWTAVQTDRATGLAATRLDSGPTHGEHAASLPDAGQLVGQDAFQLVAGAGGPPALARSLGLAALNALLPEPAGSVSERNAADLAVHHAAGRTIGVVGWFPFIPRLRAAAAGIEVFEQDPDTGFALTPGRAARLARCDLLCVTASTLLNGTLADILHAARPDAWKMLVGPSAPLCAATLALGFHAVCGVRVTDPEPVVRVLQQGGCFRQIRRTGAVRLLALE
jgi:hypothetical protein